MIFTFHIAVQLAYCIWENVVYLFIPQNTNHVSNSYNSNVAIESENVNLNLDQNSEEIIEGNLSLPNSEYNSNSNNENAIEENIILQDTIQGLFKEEDSILKHIYDVDPVFECIYDKEVGLRFIPPVYTQRYMFIQQILKQPCWATTIKKVVDFGCAEMKFESLYLKKLEGIQEIIAVDIDEELLNDNVGKLAPLIPEYLTLRSAPLKVSIFCGSVAQTNSMLVGCDAVIAIELIEHLFPMELENLPFTVFGFIQPRIAIFTTPNADFNVLFTNMTGFRHNDHKFEWSRQQFEDWGNNLILRYPDYSVTFKGIGPGPVDTNHLGCCSQMATFVKLYDSHSVREDELHFQDGDYKLIKEYVYPFDERTREEKIRDIANAFITKQILLNKKYQEEVVKEIPFKFIMQATKCYSREKLKGILTENNWQVDIDKNGYEIVIIPDDGSDDDDLDSSGYEDHCVEEQQDDFDLGSSNVDECWDNVEKESEELTISCAVESFDNWGDRQFSENTCHDCLMYGIKGTCSKPETGICKLYCDTNQSGSFSEKEFETEISIYDTPFSNGLQIGKSTCKLNSVSDQPVYQNETKTVNGCNKALDFDNSDSCNEEDINKMLPNTTSNYEHEKTELFCCLSRVTMDSDKNDKSLDGVVSFLDTSIYATPYCTKHHENYLPKSLTTQQISAECSSPLCSELNSSCSPRLPELSSEFSKNNKSVEDLKIKNNIIIQEQCPKTLDSGNVYSNPDYIGLDLDHSLELNTELKSESEGNDKSSTPVLHSLQVQYVINNTDNGDVVNNYRDEVGNSVVADMEEELLEFEAQIEDISNDSYNVAEVNRLVQVQDHIQNNKSPGEMSFDMEEERFEFEAQIEDISQDKIEKYTSLTTFINGCSNFSDSSLDQPIYPFPSWMLSIDDSLFHKSTMFLRSGGEVPFPSWLLDIQLSETEEHHFEDRISETGDTDFESIEGDEQLNYNVEFDSRAGGDQCSEH